MDWQRTKAILIAVLIVTNLILLFNIVDSRNLFETGSQNPDEEWDKVISLIQEKGIHYNGKRVSETAVMGGLELEYQMYDAEDMAQRLLGEYTQVTGKYKGKDHQEMTLENGNKLVYSNQLSVTSDNASTPTPEMPVTSDQEYVSLAEAFIGKVKLTSSDSKLWFIAREGAVTSVIYRQYDGDIFLDDAYMQVTFENEEVIRFERKWFNPSKALGYDRKVIGPAKALFRAADLIVSARENDNEPIIIDQLELGYRLDSSTLVTSVKSGEASPYWRLLTTKGQVYYIEAME